MVLVLRQAKSLKINMIDSQVSTKPKILVAPLDWGLGHATRCIPIINELLAQGCEVILAAEGKQKVLLQQEFPDLALVHLAGYDVHYSRSKFFLPFTIAGQLPKIRKTIKEENRWLKNVIQVYAIDAVISDNRFGLYHPSIPCIFLTHQLLVKIPFKPLERWVQRINYSYINKFSACWVPDSNEVPNLAGKLSHPSNKPGVPVEYLGPLSRFEKPTTTGDLQTLVILLSGPEPQRSLLEEKLLQQLPAYEGPVILVRGLPGDRQSLRVSGNVTVYNHLPSEEMYDILLNAGVVISRSGYSTVMDLMRLKKKSIVIPTPGQTEQEYLAEHLMKYHLAYSVSQDKFELQQALSLAAEFLYIFPSSIQATYLPGVVSEFVSTLHKGSVSAELV
jgi:uncharacterized protein (TIGR00661 family)